MNSEEIGWISLLGAAAAATSLILWEHDIEAPSLWYELEWPREVPSDSAIDFLRTLAADRRRHVIAFEILVSEGKLSYRMGLSKGHAEPILSQLRSHVPGVSAKLIEHETTSHPKHAWQLRLSTSHKPLRTSGLEQVSRALVTTLSTVRAGDSVIIQWLLGPRLAAMPASSGSPNAASWSEVLKGALGTTSKPDSGDLRSFKEKTQEAGFRATCRIGIDSAPEMAKSLAVRILGSMRTAESPGVRIDLKKDDPNKVAEARVPRTWPLALNIGELALLSGWPLGKDNYPGINRSGARLMPPASSIARRGRVLAEGTYPGAERPLALGTTDSLQHLHILGPTGVGKSTLMLNLIVQDMVAGRGVVVIDPKGDLVSDVLARVPTDRVSDVVVLDPADEKRPVGLNVLEGGDRSPELIADQVLAVFHDLYRENWGPRTQDILHASLLTLAGRPGMTLCALPLLLSNRAFRKSVTQGLSDTIALGSFWTWFESMSEGERQQAISPVMNKLRAFLLRPRMRAVIGQADPKFSMHQVFTERKIVLVSLAKGLLGPEAAALLGSLAVSHLWQTAQGRVRVAAPRRSPVFVYIDEFQDYLHLPTDLADVLAQARGLGVGLTLAHQHLAQLPASLRSAVLANARSRVCFQLSHEDAKLIAGSSSELTPLDFQNLGRYEAYLSLVAEGNITPFASGRTLRPPEPTSGPEAIRQMSRQLYGRDLADIEQAIAAQLIGNDSPDQGPIGRRRAS